MKYVKPALFVGIALFCTGLEAGPAAWYKWRSVESDIDICSQISPGDGWVAVKGPFQDAVEARRDKSGSGCEISCTG